MGDYKLVYFQVRGRAEPIRLTFAAAGKKFEDVRLADTDWAAEKASKWLVVVVVVVVMVVGVVVVVEMVSMTLKR